MSIRNILQELATELVLHQVGGCSEGSLIEAEAILGVRVPQDFKCYSRQYGSIAFGSTEIFGVTGKDIKMDAVAKTLIARKRENLPSHLVVILNLGDGTDACIDCNYEHGQIVLWDAGEPEHIAGQFQLSDNFAAFLTQRVSDEIGNLEG